MPVLLYVDMLTLMFRCWFFFFFFKQKTAYEMRISDWSSDVCSSDLQPRRRQAHRLVLARGAHVGELLGLHRVDLEVVAAAVLADHHALVDRAAGIDEDLAALLEVPQRVGDRLRSEERRVGKECVGTCRSRGSPNPEKKTKKKN